MIMLKIVISIMMMIRNMMILSNTN